MIGYYVHHHGTGHLHRAMTVAAHLPQPVTGFSSLPRPEPWPGPWVQLPRDDSAPSYAAADATARGLLHWAPLADGGLRRLLDDPLSRGVNYLSGLLLVAILVLMVFKP